MGHWSCTKWADRIRGTATPSSATMEEWELWREKAKAAHPFRYWLVQTALADAQRFVNAPRAWFDSITHYIVNRFVTRPNALVASAEDIKPGEWRDVGDRFLPCMFNALVDFVEVETAWHHVAWNEDADKKFNAPTGFFRSLFRTHRAWRCKEAGLDHLNWAAQLRFDDNMVDPSDPIFGQFTQQALAAQQILSLYVWWTETRKNRPSASELSGLDDFYELHGHMRLFRRDFAQKQELKAMYRLHSKIEADQAAEDEEMMCKLIRVRNSLWT